MKMLAKVLFVAAVMLLLSAIWLPGLTWQLLLTGLLFTFVGAAIMGQKATSKSDVPK
jgi:hypothetical protein